MFFPLNLANIVCVCFPRPFQGYEAFTDKFKTICTLIPRNATSSLVRYIHLPHDHTPLHLYKKSDPVKFAGYFKFVIVRNPWDRLVSLYHYIKGCNPLPADSGVSLSEEERRGFLLQKPEAVLSFPEYVHKLFEIIVARPFLNQHWWVCSPEGALLADYVGRFERVEENFEYLAERQAIPHAALPTRENTSQHKDYRVYYDDETREIVREVFKKDIELFDYDFDGPTDDLPYAYKRPGI